MDKQNKAVENMNLLQSQIQNLTEKVNSQAQTIQKQANLIQEKELSKNITELTDKVKELTAIVQGNVNFMDDVLENTNSVLTVYVGWATIIIALLAIGIPAFLSWYLNKSAKDKVISILEESFKNPNVKSNLDKSIAEYFDSDAGKETLKLLTDNTEKVKKSMEGIK